MAFEYKSSSPDTTLLYANEALLLSQKIKWLVGEGRAYHLIGIGYQVKSDFPLALKNYSAALEIWNDLLNHSQDPAIQERKANTLNNIGIINELTGKFNEAVQYYLEGVTLYKSSGNKNRLAGNYANLGNVYSKVAIYVNSIDYYLKALKIFEEVQDSDKIGMTLENIGINYYYKKDFPAAISYYNKAFKISMERKFDELSAKTLNNIGLVYQDQKKYESSLENYFHALKLTNDPVLKANIWSNLGGIYNDLGKYDYAIQYSDSALKVSESIGDNRTIAANLANIGSAFTALKKYGDAERNLLRALSLADSSHILNEQMQIEKNLSELYIQKGDYKKAIEKYKQYTLLKDSIFNNKNDSAIMATQMQYTFDIKEAATKAEQEKKDAITKQELEKQKSLRNSIAGGAGIIVLSSVFSFFFYKRKRDAEQKQKETSLNLQVSETEMKALRSQMNPHFIFNALQSIQTFLLSNKSEDANSYLLKFSKLMRLVLENSQHGEVSLEDDIQALELYMQLESIRLTHPFTYKFHIDESVNVENDFIPPLILQPFVENAIWHGLQYKPKPGHIDIYISKKDNALYATVEDNGIGRNLSKQVAQPILHKKESLGMKLTEERLKILNELKKIKAQFQIVDLFTKENKPAGTRVELSLPIAI